MIITKPQKTNTFIPTTVAKSSEVNVNFDNAFGVYGSDDFLYRGWFPFEGASLAFHSSGSFQTTTDVDLTNQLQVGDKITWEHAITTGDRFGYITSINYNGTVTNKTWISVSGSEVLNQALLSGSVGVSRAVNPFGFNLRALEAYPVGSIYINVVNTNPSTLFGGTWVAFGAGRTLVGVDTGQTEFDTVEEIGGNKNLQAHTHGLDPSILLGSRTSSAFNDGIAPAPGGAYDAVGAIADAVPTISGTGTTGTGNAGNLQPYITVYFWKRTA